MRDLALLQHMASLSVTSKHENHTKLLRAFCKKVVRSLRVVVTQFSLSVADLRPGFEKWLSK